MSTPTNPPDRRLDINAAAGPLAELFSVDLTMATVQCDGCSDTADLARYDVYADGPGLVIRCPGCDHVVLRYSTAGGRVRLDMTGTRLLVIPGA